MSFANVTSNPNSSATSCLQKRQTFTQYSTSGFGWMGPISAQMDLFCFYDSKTFIYLFFLSLVRKMRSTCNLLSSRDSFFKCSVLLWSFFFFNQMLPKWWVGRTCCSRVRRNVSFLYPSMKCLCWRGRTQMLHWIIMCWLLTEQDVCHMLILTWRLKRTQM